MVEILNIDCMAYMAGLPDKYFDLSIVDPPYGIKESSYRKNPSKCAAKKKKYNTVLWRQDKPDYKYFDELQRVSKNQIIWGGNYFVLPPSRSWIVWDKVTGDSNFADCELAWTSFNLSVKQFTFAWNGMIQGDMKNKEDRIHPTQKPQQLYKWLLAHYAKQGDKILDTHLGSGSSAIAAHNMGFDFVGTEIDSDYYNAACKRFKEQTAQLSLL